MSTDLCVFLISPACHKLAFHWSINECMHSDSHKWLAAITQVHSASATITQQLNAASASFTSCISTSPTVPNLTLPTPVVPNSFPSSDAPHADAGNSTQITSPLVSLDDERLLPL